MLGDFMCIPLRNCTNDDIIVAPGNISTCKMNREGKAVTTVIPKYHEVPGKKWGLVTIYLYHTLVKWKVPSRDFV